MRARFDGLRAQLARWFTYLSLLCFAVLLGGSLYEHLVVDSAWLDNAALIQPGRGGIDRKDFWIPAHAVATLFLLGSLWTSWSYRPARRWLLWALGAYLLMRFWTFAYFVPVGLSFEAPRDLSPDMLGQARQWVTLSILRLPLLVASTIALWLAARRIDDGARGAAEPAAGRAPDVSAGAPPLAQN